MFLIVVIVYLTMILPLLMTWLSWHFTSDVNTCWRQPREEIIQLALLALRFSLAVSCLLLCTTYTFYAVGYYFALVMGLVMPSEAVVGGIIFKLFMLIFSLPLAVMGGVWAYRGWRPLRQFFGYEEVIVVKHHNS